MVAPSEEPLIVATHRIFPETRALLEGLGTVLAPQPDCEALDFLTLSEALKRAAAIMAFMPDRVDDALLAAAPAHHRGRFEGL
jgi:hypothetical protein